MISALSWVPKGAAKRNPDQYVPSAEEIEEIKKMAAEEEEEAKLDDDAGNSDAEDQNDNDDGMDDDLPPEFQMDKYDDEENMGDEEIEEQFSDAESDKDDNEIREDDSLLLVARTEDDYSILEVYLFDESSDTLYVHHDITLPAFPLSLAWMNCPPSAAGGSGVGNFVAVGTFKPGIEIWNLDVMDVFEPSALLGGEDESLPSNLGAPPNTTGKKKKKKKKRAEVVLRPGSHTDAVLSLDWNKEVRNMLASASADTTVKLWDVTTQTAMHTFNNHKDKVQCVAWNPSESTVLASGSFDRTLVVLDGRFSDKVARINLGKDVESMAWNPHQPIQIAVSTEDGLVRGYDVRAMGKAPVYTLKAHAGACSSIAFSPGVSGMLATAGVDKHVKIWDISDSSSTCVASKSMAIGEIFTVSFNQDSPFLLAAGGSKGTVAVWDTEENRGVQMKFTDRAVRQ